MTDHLYKRIEELEAQLIEQGNRLDTELGQYHRESLRDRKELDALRAQLQVSQSILEDAESRLNGIKALRVEMVDLIGADLDATLQGLLWPKDVERHDPNRPNEGDEFSCCPYHREGGEGADCGFVRAMDSGGKPILECGACYECLKGKVHESGLLVTATRMITCPACGNKRCPHATDHRLDCTDSNEPGQPGSRYELAVPRAFPEHAASLCCPHGKRLDLGAICPTCQGWPEARESE